MATVGEAVRAAAAVLAVTSDTARLDAEVLMAHTLGVSRSDLLLRHMRDAAPEGFAELIERRQAHEPVAYIVGSQDFHGLDLLVTPAVLIPRGDSETLIEAAQASFGDRAPRRVLDLGTGSGALLLAALSIWDEAMGVGIDRSADALRVASGNAARNNLSDRTNFRPGDWTATGWRRDLGQFDLILANPPYVEENADLAPSVRVFEPAGALFSGIDGLDDYRVLVPQLPALLEKNGVAIVEIGATQAEAVKPIAEAAGLRCTLYRDLAARPRALQMVHRQNISLGKASADH
jgi:release factor glutamine methyltransferase